MEAWIHAKSSVKKWGGKRSDYLEIHKQMDHSKCAHASMKHRLIFHSSYGLYLICAIFGETIINSDGKEVGVKEIAEQHIIEDLGRIPSLDEWLKEVKLQDWMGRPYKKKETLKNALRIIKRIC